MNLKPIVHNGQRVITTEQMANVYQTHPKNIQMNFTNHPERFIKDVHYYFLEGETLGSFKESLPNDVWEDLKYAPKLILWTERGANRHCKILDTDKAWEQFENLEECYFRVKEGKAALLPMSPETLARLLTGTSSYIRTQERILIHEGHTWHDVGKMAKDVAKAAGLPYSPLLGTPPANEQLALELWNGGA